MRNSPLTVIILFSLTFVMLGCQDGNTASPPAAEKETPAAADNAEPPSGYEQDGKGCEPRFRALFDQAVVELHGTGDVDVVVLTDPLCWHCRLGHQLLGDYPEKYGRLRLLFFPRKSFIGSDMAAWILEDVAGTDKVREYVDYAYADLKQPKTKDLTEARMLVLAQFTQRFPAMLEGASLDELYARLQRDHEAHVLASARMGEEADLPGTPVLVAGKSVLVGFGPAPWLEAMDAENVCP